MSTTNKFNCQSYDGSTRDVQDSIDKRNAAVMDLEARYRQAIASLEMFLAWEDSQYKSSPATDFSSAIKAARHAVAQSKRPRR